MILFSERIEFLRFSLFLDLSLKKGSLKPSNGKMVPYDF